MNVNIVLINNAGPSKNNMPRICMYSEKLCGLGFHTGALVQVLPEPGGGVVFNLCDENIKSYRGLESETRGKGGRLIKVGRAVARGRTFPQLSVYGDIVSCAGFASGDYAIVLPGYGVVRVKKPPCAVRLGHVTGARGGRTGSIVTRLRLAGAWLSDYGFGPDSLLTAHAEGSSVVFRLRDEALEKYSSLVRYARQNRMKLLQVREKQTLYIEASGAWLEQIGFQIGDTLIAYPEQGLIKLQKPDFAALGF